MLPRFSQTFLELAPSCTERPEAYVFISPCRNLPRTAPEQGFTEGQYSKTLKPEPLKPTVAEAAIGWFKLNASNASSNPKPPNEAEPGTARCRFRRKTLHLHAIDDS